MKVEFLSEMLSREQVGWKRLGLRIPHPVPWKGYEDPFYFIATKLRQSLPPGAELAKMLSSNLFPVLPPHGPYYYFLYPSLFVLYYFRSFAIFILFNRPYKCTYARACASYTRFSLKRFFFLTPRLHAPHRDTLKLCLSYGFYWSWIYAI